MLVPDLAAKMRRVVEMGGEPPPLSKRVRLLREVRGAAPEATEYIDQELVKHIDRINQGLHEARENLEALHEQNQRLTRPPWPVAVFRQWIPDSQQALVMFNGGLRTATLAEEVDQNVFCRGDDVFLNSDLNLLVGRAPWGMSPVGETAEFVRTMDDHRIVLRWRDEEIVVETSSQIENVPLKEGDLVRWNRDTFLALEKVERNVTGRHFLDEVPDEPETAVGGQRSALESIKSALLTVLVAPDKALHYGLQRRQSLLLVGPPGCGKTLMCRVATAAIQRISGRKCFFAVVRPSEFENPYVGVTAANIRNCFEACRKLAEAGNDVVLILDEIESAARVRGHQMGYHGDKQTAALLAEIDGFADRGGVAIIALTNRKDLIDPALLERLSDVEVFVPRPDLAAAREVFHVHLSEDLPFSPNGELARDTRAEVIDVALSRIYGPNSENELSTVKFRDGSQRTVSANELMSGRLIEQICRSVRQRAFVRDVKYNEAGIRVPDIQEAVSDALHRLSTTLTLSNIRSYLADLPQDMDIVSVQPIARRIDRDYRLLVN